MRCKSFQIKMMLAAMTTLLCLAAAPVSAQAANANGPVLAVNGKVETVGSDQSIDFDLAALEAMPKTEYQTSTPWTEGVARFEGVRLSDLLKHVGATGQEVVATALNDYSVALPIVDENGADPLIAYKVNGQYMPIREKGPLWIVYPFDQSRELSSEKYFSRSIWQLNRLTVR